MLSRDTLAHHPLSIGVCAWFVLRRLVLGSQACTCLSRSSLLSRCQHWCVHCMTEWLTAGELIVQLLFEGSFNYLCFLDILFAIICGYGISSA